MCLVRVGLFESCYRQYVGEWSRLIQRREYGTSENCFWGATLCMGNWINSTWGLLALDLKFNKSVLPANISRQKLFSLFKLTAVVFRLKASLIQSHKTSIGSGTVFRNQRSSETKLWGLLRLWIWIPCTQAVGVWTIQVPGGFTSQEIVERENREIEHFRIQFLQTASSYTWRWFGCVMV
jgi:hypothetical protein